MCAAILWTHMMYFDQNHGRCYAMVLYRQMVCLWQMLLPYDVAVDDKTTDADVITFSYAKWQMLLPSS